MTIQALAWATDQQVPSTAALVLRALANHADHTNGFVHFDASTIAAEASINVASLWRYLGALERNGYLQKDERKSADGDRRDYWLILDRDSSLPWSWSAQDSQDDTSADDEPGGVEAADSYFPRPAASAPSSAPKAFRRDRQVASREQIKAAEPLPPDGMKPIIQGSRAFDAWNNHYRNVLRRPPPFIMSIIADGKPARGFYEPTLFPPAEVETIS